MSVGLHPDFRTINDFRSQRLKGKARENLGSEIDKVIYYRRCIEPEPVFGTIRQNKHFKQFTLKKWTKINIELGLKAIAPNFAN